MNVLRYKTSTQMHLQKLKNASNAPNKPLQKLKNTPNAPNEPLQWSTSKKQLNLLKHSRNTHEWAHNLWKIRIDSPMHIQRHENA